jgi:hypothetical protein
MLVAAALLMGWASVVRVRDLTGEPLTASEPEAGTL